MRAPQMSASSFPECSRPASGLELLRRELQIKRESTEKLEKHLEMTRSTWPGAMLLASTLLVRVFSFHISFEWF